MLAVGTARHMDAALLILAGLTLIVLRKFTDAGKSWWFELTTTGILALALIGAGC